MRKVVIGPRSCALDRILTEPELFCVKPFHYLLLGVLATGNVWSAEPDPLELIQRTCLRCHTEEKRKGGLLMTSREALLKGGDSGAAIQLGRSGESYLVETLYPDADPHMPPKSDLSEAEISAFRDWIDSGAPWDEEHWAKLKSQAHLKPVEVAELPESYRPVLALAFSPDGKCFAAGRGSDLEIFEILQPEDEKAPPELKSIKAITGEGDAIQSLAWSPDGKRLAAGSFRRITLLNADSLAAAGEITAGLAGRITALEFSKDSQTLVAADSVPTALGRLHFVDAAGPKITQTIESAHTDSIFDVAVSPDGKRLASVSADKLVRIWDLPKREPVKTLEGHTGYVLAAAFSPGSDRIATGGDDEDIKVWNLATGKNVSSFGSGRIKVGPVTALAWTTDPAKEKAKAEEKDTEKAKAINTDRIVAVNEAGIPRIYTDLVEHEGAQRSTGARERVATDSGVKILGAMVLDPATRRFVAGSNSGGVFLWDDAGKLVAKGGIQPEEVAEARD